MTPSRLDSFKKPAREQLSQAHTSTAIRAPGFDASEDSAYRFLLLSPRAAGYFPSRSRRRARAAIDMMRFLTRYFLAVK